MPHLSPMSWLIMFVILLMLLVVVLSFFWWFDMKNYMPFAMMKTQSTKKWKW
uniref:ATP synthase F0 subunit 8 n=1 Tax=Erpobdella octoculata TaxID=39305 RepID=A0A7D7J1E2_9ANNE|nr:ATP synthase F0 subunit 8 [Erpobdella octoculata]UZT67813.1 ATP synthase F0 subunit 8 [Erpobdella octoculata]